MPPRLKERTIVVLKSAMWQQLGAELTEQLKTLRVEGRTDTRGIICSSVDLSGYLAVLHVVPKDSTSTGSVSLWVPQSEILFAVASEDQRAIGFQQEQSPGR